MHARSIIAGAVVVAAASVMASPPACLLAAINTQPNPADVKTICATQSDAVQNAIYASCTTNNQAAAVSSFADTCQSAGVKITKIPPPSSTTAKATGLTKSGSGNGQSSGNGSSSTTSGSGKTSGASRVSAVTGVLGLSVAGFVGVLALL